MTTTENTDDMVEISDTESVVTQTVREFFDSMSLGSKVYLEGWSTRVHIFLGWETVNDEPAVILVHQRYIERSVLTELDGENHWVAVTNGDDQVERIDQGFRRALHSMYSAEQMQRALGEQLDTVRAENDRVRADFRIINDKLSEFAIGKGYCPDYEVIIGRWNRELSELKLEGRPRNFSVAIRINVGVDSDYDLYVNATATSEDQARQLVSAMNTRDVFRQLVENSCYFDGVGISVVGLNDPELSDDDDCDDCDDD